MKTSMICLAVGALVACMSGCQSSADQRLDQDRIIAVRPAVPEGARGFVERQNRLQQEKQKTSWFARKQPTQAGYAQAGTPEPAKPSFGQRLRDFFSFKKKDTTSPTRIPAQTETSMPTMPAQPATTPPGAQGLPTTDPAGQHQ